MPPIKKVQPKSVGFACSRRLPMKTPQRDQSLECHWGADNVPVVDIAFVGFENIRTPLEGFLKDIGPATAEQRDSVADMLEAASHRLRALTLAE